MGLIGVAVSRRRRRGSLRAEAGPLVAGELEIRADQFQAFVSGNSLDLTRREFELLQLLAEAKGQVLERRRSTSGSGDTRWPTATARSTPASASCARSSRSAPGLAYIHTHFRRRLPLRPRAGRPGGADAPAVLGKEAAVSQVVHSSFTAA